MNAQHPTHITRATANSACLIPIFISVPSFSWKAILTNGKLIFHMESVLSKVKSVATIAAEWRNGMRKTVLTKLWLGLLPLAAGCVTTARHSDAELYSGFTLIDPQAEKRTDNAWIVVQDGRIMKVGSGMAPKGVFAAVHDATGLYAMPGLIDAHAHIVAGPYKASVENGAPRVDIVSGDKYSRFNAAIALAFGVTTVRSPGGATRAAERYAAMIADGTWIGPEARHAGAVIQPPPLFGESFAYPTTPEQWDAEAARQKAAGMTYFKLYQDLKEDEVAQGVKVAKAHGLIPIAHLDEVSWTRAAELGVEQFEHALPTSGDLLEPAVRSQFSVDPFGRFAYRWFELADFGGPLIKQMIATLRAKRAVVTLTLIANEVSYNVKDESAIFPEAERVYYQPESFASAMANYTLLAGLWTQGDARRAKAAWPRVLQFTKLLHDSGVRLMIGTDGTGGAPMFARELGHYAEAGIPNWEVLRMATSGNATLMGLPETGRIVPGMEADMVFLRADPSLDVRNVRQVEMVVADGKPYRFDALVALAQSLTR